MPNMTFNQNAVQMLDFVFSFLSNHFPYKFIFVCTLHTIYDGDHVIGSICESAKNNFEVPAEISIELVFCCCYVWLFIELNRKARGATKVIEIDDDTML